VKLVRAAVLVEPRRIEVDEFPVPDVHEDDALLRVEATGVCGADWDPLYLGKPPVGSLAPAILGHEIVGTIERIGEVARRRWGVDEGDLVVVEEDIPCGRCSLCRSGAYRMCNGLWSPGEGMRYGFTSSQKPPYLWGGYAEYMYMHPNSVVHRVPSSVAPLRASLTLPVANGIEWVRRYGQASIGDCVVILGPGQAGLGCVIGAREAGAGKVILVGLSADEDRLSVAKDLGADLVVKIDEIDVLDAVVEASGGKMADLVVDATHGAPAAAGLALDLVGLRGVVVLAGMKDFKAVTNFVTDKIVTKELTIRGATGRDRLSTDASIALLATTKYPFDDMNTHVYNLDECELAIRSVGGLVPGQRPIHATVLPHAVAGVGPTAP
jgi:threonine dehydrogenase-like Zn-dependent dehydrogenase